MRVPVVDLHARVPGITEDLLAGALAEDGADDPYRWLCSALPPAGVVLDLCCGSARLADVVGAHRYLGVDRSEPELAVAAARRPRARTRLGDALTAEPDGPIAAVALSMGLMLLPLPVVLHRAARWLGPGGVLAATVPLRDPTLTGTPYHRLLVALGWTGEPFPEPLDDLDRRCADAGFAVSSDELRWFAVPIVSADDRALLLRSFYLPVTDLTAAGRLLADLSAETAVLPYPIRRVVLTR